jgi:HAD superfamily hydrolase (TIGR01490 family)
MSVQKRDAKLTPARSARSIGKGPRAAAFYDLDGTLVDFNLVHAALFIVTNLAEWTGRAAYFAGFLSRIPQLYSAERYDRRLLNIKLFEGLRGVSLDRLKALGEEYCERVLAGRVYPQARALLEGNRAAGFEPVLVTGSPDFIVAPLARKLGISEFAANRLMMSRGLATGRLVEPVMAGSDKADWCAAWAARHGIDLSRCWGYADSYYDLPFLCAMGHPVAVNPDQRLRATALNRHWPIVNFKMDKQSAARSVASLIKNWMWSAGNGATGS